MQDKVRAAAPHKPISMSAQRPGEPELVGVMNDTKWDELRLAMYALGANSPSFRIKDVKTDTPSSWDREWFYHFRLFPYSEIEWVELRLDSPEQRSVVHERLCTIHLPGEETSDGVRIFGWIPASRPVHYIR